MEVPSKRDPLKGKANLEMRDHTPLPFLFNYLVICFPLFFLGSWNDLCNGAWKSEIFII